MYKKLKQSSVSKFREHYSTPSNCRRITNTAIMQACHLVALRIFDKFNFYVFLFCLLIFLYCVKPDSYRMPSTYSILTKL
jgi:hypothetical protein